MNGIEVWIVIEDAPRYSVSSWGRVRNDHTGRILKPGTNPDGYSTVVLARDGQQPTPKKIHRLVAIAFFDNKDLSLQVNHDNGVKDFNHVSNLEWNTQSENQRHAYRNGLNTPSGGIAKTAVRIIETGEIFESQHACARAIQGSQSNVNACLNGRIRSYKGYTFEYVGHHGD